MQERYYVLRTHVLISQSRQRLCAHKYQIVERKAILVIRAECLISTVFAAETDPDASRTWNHAFDHFEAVLAVDSEFVRM